MRSHHETVVAPTVALNTDDDVTQRLAAEVHGPAHADARGINVETAHTGKAFQRGIVIVALVLHTGRQRRHGQIVRGCHGMNIARKIQGVRRQRDALGQTAARRGAFHTHGGAAGGLTDGGGGPESTARHTLQKADGRRRFAFAQRRRGDGRHIHILAFGTPLQATQDVAALDFPHEPPIGQQLVVLKPQFPGHHRNGLHACLGIPRNFPVGIDGRIQRHVTTPRQPRHSATPRAAPFANMRATEIQPLHE